MVKYRIKTITEYYQVLGLPKPEHPLIGVIDLSTIKPPVRDESVSLIFDFYCISFKRDSYITVKYGQQPCDNDKGVLFCMAPGRVWSLAFKKNLTKPPKGFMILIHPDFLWNTPLAKTIKQYEYFGYSVCEALYLSDREESIIAGIIQYITLEYQSNMDKFSQNLIISQLEVIFNYTDRFYQRQCLTRKVSSNQIISRVEDVLMEYFNSDALASKGLPTVADIAGRLNVSAGYLSEMLKTLTGQNTQQLIHSKLIEKAKECLCTTNLSVSEIAYKLGFEHIQSFSKIFKTKTKLTPSKFRSTFQ